MHFRLKTDVARMAQYWEFLNNEDLRLSLGLSVDVEEDDIELPFRLQVSYSPDLEGNPKVEPLYDYVSSVKVMSKRLAETIQAAGVDNLQIFPALVTDSVTGVVHEDYVVVNVVGIVSAAKLASSEGTKVGSAYYFDKIAIDPAMARDLLFFRLKQSPIEIIVHESIARAVTNGNFRGVVLEPAAATPP